MLINVKMPTIVGILTLMSMINFVLSRVEHEKSFITSGPGLQVINFEYSLRLKIKCNDWLPADTCPQAANHCAFFAFENELKFYNLEARPK